jgi:hypothetical protein
VEIKFQISPRLRWSSLPWSGTYRFDMQFSLALHPAALPQIYVAEAPGRVSDLDFRDGYARESSVDELFGGALGIGHL